MPDDLCVVDSTGALALKEVPKRMLILGGDMVGTHAGDMIGEIALAIEMGADAVDIGKTIHPHPTLGNPSAWRRKWHMAVARICRRQRSRPRIQATPTRPELAAPARRTCLSDEFDAQVGRGVDSFLSGGGLVGAGTNR